MKTYAESVFDDWVGQNVHNIPGLENLDEEVDRLRARIQADLVNQIPMLEAELGDLDDRLREAYEAVHDPELGFKDF